MYNEVGKKPKFTLVTVITLAAVMLVAATTEMAITGYALAHNRNQATSAANDCGNGVLSIADFCQDIGAQNQGEENSVAQSGNQEINVDVLTREPTGFTIEGTGTAVTGTSPGQTVSCKETDITSGITVDLDFSAQSDGTVSGTYTIDDFFEGIFREGLITDGSTDGSTFSLTGEGVSLCSTTNGVVTISGTCGDDVTIMYDDVDASGTFTGDVECTLT